ncbi:MAG: SOS response-associated peptidase [Candidatus Accumulibacter sp.]|uniref:SOS response-associated peptidase n=1 Tax=Accumulibacter sp. TaxID=2053492 RepID=UPI0025D23819|nr:SOS response-associated peptidase [Accumulibacter sp.]MCP5247988.1 SOS response-associated peptidase [Accumulibacter sp.]
MCGRYALDAPRSRLSWRFDLDECVVVEARYNITPATDIPVIRQSPAGQRVLHLLRWGLQPHWSRQPASGARLINARGESLADKPAFRDAFRRRRCLIPASGFYEWQTIADEARRLRRQPYYISLKSTETMAFGGLWESWTTPTGEVVRSCCIVTTAANDLLHAVHDRMPLILAAEQWPAWLAAPAAEVVPLIRPLADAELQCWPVSQRVGQASNDDPALIVPLAEERR